MVDKFITYIIAEKRYSQDTAKAYQRDINIFLESLKSINQNNQIDITRITPDDIRSWIISLADNDKLKPQSINRMLYSIKAFFKYLHKQGEISKNPTQKIHSLKTQTRLPSYIPESKMGNVIASIADSNKANEIINLRNELIILFFYTTGIRLAELISITTDSFNHDMSEIKIRGKGDKERIIPIVQTLRLKIYDYLDKIKAENICLNEEKSLFLTEKGELITKMEVYRLVKTELAKAGIQGKRSPHVLRHTFATHMLNDGADMREIQELLGHNSLVATQIYTHNSITKLKTVYKSAHPRATHKTKDKEDKL